jgi:hypothetical protein
VPLHGFIKKTQKTPDRDLRLAVQRMKLDYQVFYFDKVGTCGLCHACGCPIFQ